MAVDRMREDGSLRVLMVHDRYRSGAPSGEDMSFEQEASLLKEFGHEVTTYSISSDDIDTSRLGTKATLVRDVMWSERARRDVTRLISERHIDILHVQNTFPRISPAVVRTGTEVPVVQSLRNYRLMCVNGALYRDGAICTECVGRAWPWHGILHASYRNSRAQSTLVAATTALHRAIGTWDRYVDLFAATSRAVRDLYVDHGLSSDRIVIKNNLVHPDPGIGAGDGGFVLIAGRLSEPKGIRTVLEAVRILERDGAASPEIVLIGDGPLRLEVEEASQESSRLRYLGHQTRSDTLELMKHAACVAVPSNWYEPFGRTAAEAFACGAPVLASAIGGLQEIVRDGHNGWLVPPGDAGALARAIGSLHARLDPSIRRRARMDYEARFSAEAVYRQLMDTYGLAARTRAARTA